MFDEPLHAFDREAFMLPFNIVIDKNLTIQRSTAEIYRIEDDAITFRLTQPKDRIEIKTSRTIVPNEDYDVTKQNDDQYIITSKLHGKIHDYLTIHFK